MPSIINDSVDGDGVIAAAAGANVESLDAARKARQARISEARMRVADVRFVMLDELSAPESEGPLPDGTG